MKTQFSNYLTYLVVELYQLNLSQHKLPDIWDREQCEKDAEYRRHIRLKYPGACSLMYQNVISIFIDCLLKWNPDTQECDGPSILGDVIAFAPAHEEQARYTLHSHWQVWVKLRINVSGQC